MATPASATATIKAQVQITGVDQARAALMKLAVAAQPLLKPTNGPLVVAQVGPSSTSGAKSTAASGQKGGSRPSVDTKARELIDKLVFEREQLGRSKSDQKIATALHGAGLKVDLDSDIARYMRVNQDLSDVREVGTSALSGFLIDLYKGTSVSKALKNASNVVFEHLAKKASDQLMSGLIGMAQDTGLIPMGFGGKGNTGANDNNPLLALLGGGGTGLATTGGALTGNAGMPCIPCCGAGTGIGVPNLLKSPLSPGGSNGPRDINSPLDGSDGAPALAIVPNDQMFSFGSAVASAGTGLQEMTNQVQGATAATGDFSFSIGGLFEQLMKSLGGDSKGIGDGIGSFFTTLFGGGASGVAAASGGYVFGPGSGTSDSIPALLSNGEFVVNAAATRRFGSLLHAINDNTLHRFAMGGMVPYGIAQPVPFNDMTAQAAPATAVAAPVHVNVQTLPGTTADVKPTRNADGSVSLDVMMRQVKSELAKDFQERGSLARSLETHYGVRKVLA